MPCVPAQCAFTACLHSAPSQRAFKARLHMRCNRYHPSLSAFVAETRRFRRRVAKLAQHDALGKHLANVSYVFGETGGTGHLVLSFPRFDAMAKAISPLGRADVTKAEEFENLKKRIHNKLVDKLDLSKVGDLQGDVLRFEPDPVLSGPGGSPPVNTEYHRSTGQTNPALQPTPQGRRGWTVTR